MSNIAVIFAGGAGARMNTRTRPKQFLELHGKPIMIYTLEAFEKHPEIDGIVIVCIESWIDYLEKLIAKFDITKVKCITPGGESGQESIYNGLVATEQHFPHDSIVLIHDGVRPLIDEQTISENIRLVKETGSCITCIPTIETFIIKEDDGLLNIPSRQSSLIARAPQSFILKDIIGVHRKAIAAGETNYIDSCSMMNRYGYHLSTTIGPMENIKITTPSDYNTPHTCDQ